MVRRTGACPYHPRVRILRLSHSGDTYREVPEQQRSRALVAAAIEAATGEPVETIHRVLWPSPELPDLVDGWIARYRPDVVLLWLNCYWFTYVPLPRVRRSRNQWVRRAGKLAKRAGIKQPIAARISAIRLQRIAASGEGHEFFEPEAVADLMGTVIRRILTHEDVSLLVRGSEWASPTRTPGLRNWTLLERGEARRRTVHRALKPLCEQLHVPYFCVEDGLGYFRENRLCADGLHPNAATHARMAAEEIAVILALQPAGRGA
jgi:hypothetical protein